MERLLKEKLTFISIIVFIYSLQFADNVTSNRPDKLENHLSLEKSFSYRDLKQIAYYYRERKKLSFLCQKRAQFAFDVTSKNTEEEQTVILIIGESMSRSHLSIYGYRRNTTPLLKSLDNLFVFQDVISPASQTRESLKRMLTLSDNLNTELFYTKGSILTAAKNASFETHWISNQMVLGISDTETSVIAKDATNTDFINTDWHTNSLDGKMLPYLKQALQKESKKKFIVMHMLGNHFKYEKRYPRQERFILKDNFVFPSYIDDNAKKVINHYDNSLKYSDYVIHNVIKLAEDYSENAVVVYVSDHGEEMYEDENLHAGHGSPELRPEAVNIPFFIWASESYVDGHKEKIESIKTSLNNSYISEDLFHTMCGIMDIDFEEYDATRNIISPHFLVKERILVNSNKKLFNYKDLK